MAINGTKKFLTSVQVYDGTLAWVSGKAEPRETVCVLTYDLGSESPGKGCEDKGDETGKSTLLGWPVLGSTCLSLLVPYCGLYSKRIQSDHDG